MPDSIVLGLDVGGTWTRALLATTAGDRLGTGKAPGGNPITHGHEAAIGRIADAVEAALNGTKPETVEACVIGLAGAGKFATDAELADWTDQIRDRLGLGGLDGFGGLEGLGRLGGITVVNDIAVAFAAGTPRACGSILLAGTGAIAARVHDRELTRMQDGYGWLLGDDGSGFWIGRQAVRATLAAIDGRAEMTALPRLVLAAYGSDLTHGSDRGHRTSGLVSDQTAVNSARGSDRRRHASALVSAVNDQPAVNLAALAPLVMRAHEAGDPAAERIVEEAADILIATVERTAPDPDGAPIVLAGGVLAPGSPVRDRVEKSITERWPHATVTSARDGAAGAAWLAALPMLDDVSARTMHERLLSDP